MYQIFQQLCISLNDIEYTIGELSTLPETLQFEQIIAELTIIEGEEQAALAHITLSNLICSTQDDVQCRLEKVVNSVAQKVNRNQILH